MACSIEKGDYPGVVTEARCGCGCKGREHNAVARGIILEENRGRCLTMARMRTLRTRLRLVVPHSRWQRRMGNDEWKVRDCADVD